MPNVSDAYNANTHLTNFVEGVVPKGLVYRDIVDVLSVRQKSGTYYEWNKSDQSRIGNTERAPGSDPNVFNVDIDRSGTYTATKRTVAMALEEDLLDNTDVPQLREALISRAKSHVEMDTEARVATAMTTTGNYASSNFTTLSGTSQWNNASFTGSIENDFDTAKEAIRTYNFGADTDMEMYAIIPQAVANVIKKDDKVRELIKYTQDDLLVNGDLPPTMWGLKVIIPRVTYTSSQKGASSATVADVWGKDVVVGMKTGGSQINEPSFAKLFVHQKYQALDGFARSWTDEAKDYTEFVEYVTYNDIKITSNVGGYLINDCIA